MRPGVAPVFRRRPCGCAQEARLERMIEPWADRRIEPVTTGWSGREDQLEVERISTLFYLDIPEDTVLQEV